MTTDIAVLERALVVMAVCMAIQTLLCIAAAIGALVAWRRASDAVAQAKAAAEVQVAELRSQLERMSATVDQTARALRHGTEAVDEAIHDMRDTLGTVKRSVGSVASAVTGPRTALAVGLLQGFNMWRKHKSAQRVAAPATSEL
ncbi:MAG TPA: hypothetical protein VEA16_22275 [Vicinamibacterales bacterium]|nr:hypothetical protein [Vicinamibacterales bacterium]